MKHATRIHGLYLANQAARYRHDTSTAKHGMARHDTMWHDNFAVSFLIVPPCIRLGLGMALWSLSHVLPYHGHGSPLCPSMPALASPPCRQVAAMCRGAPPSRRRAAAAHYTNTCLLPPVRHLDSLEDSRLRHRVLEARRAAPPSA